MSNVNSYFYRCSDTEQLPITPKSKSAEKVQIIVFCTINNYSETFDTENEKASRF